MRVAGHLWARWLALVLVAWVGLGCSLLVDPDSQLECVVPEGGDDPCPENQHCVKGRCEKRSTRDSGNDICAEGPNDEEETCNGEDDDCDGETDEGHDADGDGVSWCGDGTRDSSDCDDFDPKSSPLAQELCDGLDNDCDGQVDEEEDGEPLCDDDEECLEQRCVKPSCLYEGSSVRCPEGTRCDPSGKCVEGAGCSADSCAEGEQCDEDSGTCVGRSKPNGDPCVRDEECGSGSCMPAAALAMRMDAQRVCGESCCSDADCDASEFCFASGTGARSCLPRSMDPRPAGAPQACGSSSDCDGADCVMQGEQTVSGANFVSNEDLFSAVCAEGVGEGSLTVCASDSECRSGVCEIGFGVVLSVCTLPCGSTADCVIDFVGGPVFCRYRPVSAFGGDDPDYGGVCVLAQEGLVGMLEQGEPCAKSADCLDGACVASSGQDGSFCANTCCNDAQCAEGTACRPISFRDHYEMRCIP